MKIGYCKKRNPRQWIARVLKKKCWDCNVYLVPLEKLYAFKCPCCSKIYPELVRQGWENDIKIFKGFGYSGKKLIAEL